MGDRDLRELLGRERRGIQHGSVGGQPSACSKSDTSPATIAFDVIDAEGHPVDVEIAFRVTGSAAFLPVQLTGNTDLVALPSSPTGVRHERMWEFAAAGQLGTERLTQDIELMISSGPQRTEIVVIDLGNDAPVVESIAAIAPGGVRHRRNRVHDFRQLERCHLRGCRVPRNRCSRRAVAARELCVREHQAGERRGSWPSPGTRLTFVWDTAADLDLLERDVRIRITPAR